MLGLLLFLTTDSTDFTDGDLGLCFFRWDCLGARVVGFWTGLTRLVEGLVCSFRAIERKNHA